MSTSRETLTKEAALLDSWAQQGALFGPDPIFAGWSKYFTRWSLINRELIGLSDAEFNQALDAEIARLNAMKAALGNDDNPGANFWRDMFDLDIANAQALKI